MSDTLKQEYQEKLGEDFGTVLYEIRNDWLTALVRLKEYRVLFSDHDAVKLLNAAGAAFMWDVQQILWRDLLLHVTRLTDPATMGGHKNLSVRGAPAILRAAGAADRVPGAARAGAGPRRHGSNGSRCPTRLAQSADQPFGSGSGHRPRRGLACPDFPAPSTEGARRRACCDQHDRWRGPEARNAQ